MTEREYNNCVRDYADGLYRFVLKSLKNEADAEDVVQSAFEELWKLRSTVIPETAKSLLYTIAYRKMIDWIRKNKKMSFVEEVETHETRTVHPPANLKDALHHALEKLDATKKALVLLKDYEGYS